MRKSLIILSLIIFPAITSSGQKIRCDTSYLNYCVYALAHDSMGGRLAGSGYEKKAAKFIVQQFTKLKIKPYLKNIFEQEFDFTTDSINYKSQNIIGFINNHAEKNIIIGTHYDHIGFGGKRSRSYGKHEVHNGADDNASGVALMLGLAKNLKKKNNKGYNYIFAAFGAHEVGLFGSEYFVKSNCIDSNSVKLMINLDMVGRADKSAPTLFIASNDSLKLENITNLTGSTLKIKAKELPVGDHTIFARYHIPVLFFTTGMHEDYHKTSDDAAYINYIGLSKIEESVYKFMVKF